MNIILSGAHGKMGREIQAAAEQYGVHIIAGFDSHVNELSPFPQFEDPHACTVSADALIDFSAPQAFDALYDFLMTRPMPAVLCTTGYTPEAEAKIVELARCMPIFRSANMSLGIHVLKKLAAAAQALLPGFDIEIIEKHHNQKADAPSGTALSLYHTLATPDSAPVYGRTPQSGKRRPQDIGLHAVRGGSVAGDHEIGYYGPSEIITLSHHAQSRSVFAHGALKAAQFLVTRPKGLYSMEDMLKL